MSGTNKGLGGQRLLSSRRKKQIGTTTALPPKNYLYMGNREQIETPNLINIYRQEYKSKHFKFGTSLPSKEYIEELENIKDSCDKTVKELDITGDDLQWVGDKMAFQDDWPLRSTTFRIAQTNVNGLSFVKDNFKIDMYLQGLMALQVDVAAIQEINLNLKNGKVHEKFTKAMKRYDQRANTQTACIRSDEGYKIYRPGGHGIWNNGVYTGRIIKKGQDKHGRWAFTVLAGKRQQEVMIVSAYNTCMQAAEDTGTIAGQLRRVLHKEGDNKQTLRNLFYKDIKEFIIQARQKGTEIILAMDANTGAQSEELKTLRVGTGLVDAFKCKHKEKQHPRTYFRGRECLDYIFVSTEVAQSIVRVGYAPFYTLGKYDHRLLYVDINWDNLFRQRPDPTQARGRKLSIKNRRVSNCYKNTLKKLEEKAGVSKGIDKVLNRLKAGKQTDEQRIYCIKKLKNYKTIMLQLMVSANKKATKSKPSIFKWSVTLKKNGVRMRYWNERKKSSERGDDEGLNCRIPPGYNPPTVATQEDIMNEYYKAQVDWVKTKDTSMILHHQFMVDLLEHIEEKRGISKETARKYLYHQEATRAGHEKQSRYLRTKKRGLLTELLVPAPHTSEKNAHVRVQDEEAIEAILLRRNKTKLTEAVISPFCRGPLADSINENGKCKVSTRIVEGRYDVDTIDKMDIKNKKEVKMILKELARKRDKDGKLEPDVNVTITAKDFQDMFNKKRETISCGPSGIIMPHWKIIAEDEDLSAIQACLMEAPFRYGFTYTEWEVSVHCMLLKDELPYYHRLRIIQLFEGDLNGALQLLFGRRQMHYMEKQNLNSDATYGGRKGKGCHQALNRIQYTTLYSRTMRQPVGMVDVDATGCFDRMVGRLLSLINQCNGMPQNAAACQAEVLHNMKHFVKTKRGVSEKFIRRDEETLLEGNGQGNAASVPGWHGHNELLCKVYKKLIHGSKIISPDQRINFEQWLASFIDDNKMLLSFNRNETTQVIVETCQRSLQLWETLLNITGGAVELKKCSITLLQYEEGVNYKWYSSNPGVPILKKNGAEHVPCKITREGEEGVVIQQQSVTEGTRLLGVTAAANGTFKQDYEIRLEKSRELASRLLIAPLEIALTWQAYYCRWKPAITYGLPITTFSRKECQKIQSPFYGVLLPKLGINRHMPRALLHAPAQLAGLQLLNVEAEQLALHVAGVIKQVRKQDRVGQTMIACIDALQIYLGTMEQFFSLQAHKIEHRPDRKMSQLVYIWEELNQLGCKLVSDEFWTPAKNGENDGAIMDAIIETKIKRKGTTNHLPKQAIWLANACRLYLKVTMISDISSACGKYILNWAMDGSQRSTTTLVYPNQDKPPPQAWRVWRECLLASYLKKREMQRPTLHIPLEFKEPEVREEWRNKVIKGMALEEAVELLPAFLVEALGKIRLPCDNGRQLSRDMQQSKTVSWTDGSVKDKIGAHAYTIRVENDKDEYCLSGTGSIPGDDSSLTSLRAEHYGVLAVIVLVEILTIIHGQRDTSTHRHYTDSKAVLTRLQEWTYMTDSQYDCTDYDVWKATEYEIAKLKKVEVEIYHIKAHQREDLHNKKKMQGPLTRYATYNDWCDKEAEKERMNHTSKAQVMYIKAAKIYLKTPTTLVTASAYNAIYNRKILPEAEEYVLRKLSLNQQKYNSINWEALGNYINKLAITQKIKVMKYIYDWQNVGAQKAIMKLADEGEDLCPYKCGAIETSMHYLVCKNNVKKASIMCMEAINKWMIRVRTNNKIRTYIMKWMYTQLPYNQPGLNIQYEAPSGFARAVEQQEKIGWKLTMKGLISRAWGELQEAEYERIREREDLAIWYTGNWWTKHLIKHIVYWALNEWQRRNETLHQDKEIREREKKQRKCQEEIIELYETQETNPNKTLRRYFKKALIDRLQQNPARQQQWINSIRALMDKTAIQNAKNRL
jgi:hypothetical protein